MESDIMKRLPFYLIIFMILGLSMACTGSDGEAEPAAEEPEVVVETVVVVATPTPEPEPEVVEQEEEAPAPEDLPDLEVPQAQPGEPTVTANVDLNVRRGPGTIYSVVGALRAGNSARILGSNPARTWWKIECPGGSGECWVSAGHQFSTAENAENVAVAAVPPAPTQPSTVADAGTYTPTATATATVDPQATPTPTYPPATATYIASQATATPTATATGQATATATPTTAAGATATATTQADPPTPTYTPTTEAAGPPIAPLDGDSINNPALFVNFRPTGERQLNYSNDISQPEGDIEDWVKFNTIASQSPTTYVWITVECNGYDAASEDRLRVTLWDGFEEQLSLRASCGDVQRRLTVEPNHDYTARIHFQAGGPYYVQYNLTIYGRLP
jgi:uncharacterized protein YgiM (DUF1202 family)